MPAIQSGRRFDEASRKWRDLAERRLVYFTELYRSGRWKHYYTQESFMARMVEVVRAVTIWKRLAAQAPASVADDNDLRPAA
jgi:uncharacterized repeat protein (TIGR03809 family)